MKLFVVFLRKHLWHLLNMFCYLAQQRKEFCSHKYPVYPKASDNCRFLCLKYNHRSKTLSSTYLEAQKALKGKITTCLVLIFLPRHPLLALAGDTTLDYRDL